MYVYWNDINDVVYHVIIVPIGHGLFWQILADGNGLRSTHFFISLFENMQTRLLC